MHWKFEYPKQQDATEEDEPRRLKDLHDPTLTSPRAVRIKDMELLGKSFFYYYFLLKHSVQHNDSVFL